MKNREPMAAQSALLLIAAAAAAALAHALWVSQVTDDAGISLAYARSLARGDGLRLTPLSPRVEAFSNPLWVMWLALGDWLRLDGPRFAQISGALCAAAAVFLVGLLPSRLGRRMPRPIDAVAPWVLALDTTYAFWSGAGLETGAFALALAAAMALLDRGWWSALPAGLLCLLRPEGPLYLLALAPLRSLGGPARRTSRPAGSIAWVALAALPLALWVAFRRGYYGQWLPNAYYAKAHWDYGGWRYLARWFVEDPWHWALCAVPFVLLAASTRRAGAMAVAVSAAGAAFILWSRGDWMEEHRFVAHVLPAAALAAGLVPAAFDALSSRWLGAGAAAALIGAGAWGARARSPIRRESPILPLSYVAEQGRWFRDRARKLGLTGYRLAHFDLGGSALESGAEVIDMAGLADLYIGRVGYQAQRQVRDYVLGEVRPEMINLHGPCEYLRQDPRFLRDYHLEARGLWGENFVRSSLLRGVDERCPPAGLPQDLGAALRSASPARVRDLWLCARAHLPAGALPEVSALAARLAAEGLRSGDRDSLDAAVTLDPLQTAAAQRLLRLRLSADPSPDAHR
ncbi:MAG TPA: hypothetical protein VFL36_11665 [Myxococcales bacterium]|nr:hypothetical protein [Myxococcales bacterium]